MTYIDTEGMRSAANRMNEAADMMNRAASNLQSVIEYQERVNSSHQASMENFVSRFEAAIERLILDCPSGLN